MIILINSLTELYQRFDVLYKEILIICKTCTYHDCEGYTWLLPEEADNLEYSKAQIIEINGNCSFINPFVDLIPTNFETMKPKCPLLDNKLCSVYNQRPLVCRMYPVGLTSIDGKISFVLFSDCQYSMMMSHMSKMEFIEKVLDILSDCSLNLFDTITTTYSAVDNLFKYPDGKNEYEVLASCRDLRVVISNS